MEAAMQQQPPKSQTPPAAATAAPAPRKSVPVLMPDRIGHAEDKRHDWVVDLPMTVTLEDAMEPSYWAHVSDQMDPGDHIELRAEDMSWVAYLIVTFCSRNYAHVKLDRVVKLEVELDAPASSLKHKVEWKGPRLKYCVIRLADSQPLKDGLRTEQEALLWLSEHERTVGM